MIALFILGLIITILNVFMFLQSIKRYQRTIISFSASFVLFSIFYYFILVLNIHFTLGLYIILFINLPIFIYHLKSKNLPVKFQLKLDSKLILFTFLLLYGTISFLHYSGRWGDWDAYAIWNLHGKFLFYENWTDLFTNDISWTHPDYPLFIPALNAMIWRALNTINAIVPVIIAYLPFLGIVSLFYLYFKHKNSVLLGLIIILFIVIDKRFMLKASSQMADTYIAYFYLLAIMLFSDQKEGENRRKALPFVLGFCSSVPMWVKNEGIVFFIIFSIVYIIRFRKFGHLILQFFIGSLIIIIAVASFKMMYAPANDLLRGQGVDTLQKIVDYNRYYEIAKSLVINVFIQVPLVLFLLAFFILFNVKKLFRLEMYILFLTLICYLFVYVITPHDLKWHLDTSLIRLIHHLYPAVLFVLFKILIKAPFVRVLN